MTEIQLGPVSSDGISDGRTFAADDLAGVIVHDYGSSHVMVGLEQSGQDPDRSWTTIEAEDEERAEAVFKKDTALAAVTGVLNDVRERERSIVPERSIVFGGALFNASTVAQRLAETPDEPAAT